MSLASSRFFCAILSFGLFGCIAEDRLGQFEPPPYEAACPTTYEIFSGIVVNYAVVQLDPAIRQFELFDAAGVITATFIGNRSDLAILASLNGLAIGGQVSSQIEVGGRYTGSITYVQGRRTITLDCVLEVDQLSTDGTPLVEPPAA